MSLFYRQQIAYNIFFFFLFIWVLVKIISLILSRQSLGGVKTVPREKPPHHPQAELRLSLMWPKLGSNPQQCDDERFRALKISSLNNSAALFFYYRVL